MGNGSLIVFVALIFVAAIAAGVFVQSSSTLQAKSLATGNMAQDEVSRFFTVIQIWGESAHVGHLDRALLRVKLGAGSGEMILSDVDIRVETWNGTWDVSYGSGYVASSVRGDNSYDDVVERDEIVEISLDLPSLGEAQLLRFTLIPALGQETMVELKTPDLIVTDRVELFP